MAHTSRLSKAEQEKMALISGVELFSTLLEDDLCYVLSRTGFRTVGENTALFSAGETALQFFIVKSGSVSITANTDAAGPRELARYVAGDVFGDFHFVINGPYNATAITLEKTELLVFPEDGLSFDRLSDEKPDTASRILLKSISMIDSRLRSTNQLIAENTPWIRELRKQIFTDPPTGLWNKAFMDSELPQQLSGTVAVIMVKPDKFKELNDAVGHAAGDVVLGQIASMLMKLAKTGRKGWAIRLRSNEMCLIVPNCTTAAGKKLASEIRTAFPGMVPEQKGVEPFALSASMAVGFWPDDNKSWTLVAEQTNQAMQEVWKTGGDRIALLRESRP